MGSTWRRWLAVPLLVALVAGCSGGGGGDDDESAEPAFERETSTFDQEDAADEEEAAPFAGVPIDLDEVDADDVDDEVITATLEELDAFWADEFDEVSAGGFQSISGGFFPYGPDQEAPGCGEPFSYDVFAGNAFYCSLDDFIAWDTDGLTNGMLDQFGAFSLVIVMAHEFGHAIQERVAFIGPTIAAEQQADCFAGSFTAFVAAGESEVLEVSPDDLDSAVAGFLSLRDSPGTPINDPQAHGSAFDRVGAFQDGFLNGSARCGEYEDIFAGGGTTAIPLEFGPEDFQTEGIAGNAPFDPDTEGNIFDLTFGSLETFWTEAMDVQFGEEWAPLFPDHVVAFSPDDPDSLPECPGIDITAEDAAGQAFTCFGDPDDPDDDFIAFDIDLAAGLYEQVGDFAVSGIISQQYAFVAQVLLGNLESDKPSFLQADCFSGAWAGALTEATLAQGGQELLPEFDGAVSISAGDLDESVQAFLLLGEGNDPDVNGSTFERVAAFRDGFLNGLDSCETYLDGGAPTAEEGVPEERGR